ncbi:MAG: hypothetical protein KAV87_30650 [Desulfobacteraceae bacterium]|nr:hypothetical protein [Desulfobacteraceae bacterium]
MPVKRLDLVRYLKKNGFHLLRGGAKHSIYTKGTKTLPVKRQRKTAHLRVATLIPSH